MEGRGTADGRAHILRMQEGVREWVRRPDAAEHGSTSAGEHGHPEGGARRLPPLAVLAALTASACCPLFAVSAGAFALAGAGVVSAMGTGVLSGLLASAFDRARERGEQRDAPLPAPELKETVAAQIRTALTAGDDRARQLLSDIAAVLREIGAGEVAVRTVIATGDAELGRDIVSALADIGDGFSELRFLVQDVAQTGLSIRESLDEQGADVRTVIDQNYQQATCTRLILDTVRVIERRTRFTSAAVSGDEAGPTWTRGCPYRGLLPFGEDDAEVFYGREQLTAELTVTAARQMKSGGMVVVTGASGAGKSSLLRAGLLPALARGEAGNGSQHWPRFVLTPGEAPLSRLAAPLQALHARQGHGASLREMLARDPDKAAILVREAIEVDLLQKRREVRAPARMILVIDQFEQLFTLSRGSQGEAERHAFITALCALGTGTPGQVPPALVLIAVRGDFWARCAEFPLLGPHMRAGQFVVGPMTDPELRLAITGPAEAARLRIEQSLPDTILSDLRAARRRSDTSSGPDSPGVLPLLSEAMSQTWENREGNLLTGRGYAQAGGVRQAVSNRAESVYRALPSTLRVIAQDTLVRMTVAGQDGEFAGRPVARAQLYAGYPAAEVDAVLEALADARLIVLDQQNTSISHDVLLHAWPRLRGWLERDRGALLVQSQLAEDTAAWHDHGTETSYLYRGAQLAGVMEAASIWASEPARYPPITTQQRDFLDASGYAQTRQARRTRAAVISLALLLIVSVVSAGAAGLAAHAEHHAALNAASQASSALAGELAAQSEQLDTANPIIAAQLAAAAWHISPTPQAEQSMLDVLAQPERAAFTATSQRLPVSSMVLDHRDQLLITGGVDGLVRIWDVATHHEIGSPLTVVHDPDYNNGPVNAVVAMALSANGNLLATAAGDGVVQLWNLTSHQEIGQSFNVGPATVMTFSPDGRTLAVGDNGEVRLWNVETRKVTQQFGPLSESGASAMAFSPDGKLLAVADGLKVELWSAAAGNEITARAGTTGTPFTDIGTTLAFSPDGQILAIGGGDGKLRLWNVPALHQIGAPITVVSNDQIDNYVSTVAFSPDGGTVATGGGDGVIRLWDLTTHQQIGQGFTGNIGGGEDDNDINAILFSSAGNTLTAAGSDGIVRLWDLDVYREIGTPITPAGPDLIDVAGLAFSPDGKLIATANGNGTVSVWNVTSHHQVGRTIPDPIGGFELTFSPSGNILAIADDEGEVRLWNVTKQRQTSITIGDFRNGGLTSLAFNLSGTVLATGDSAGKVRLWSVATGKPLGQPLIAGTGSANSAGPLAFSPDGQILAAGNDNGQVKLWILATHRQVGSTIMAASTSPPEQGLSEQDLADQEVTVLAFNPAGDVLATGDMDGSARLWNLQTDQEIGPPITVSQAGVDSLADVVFTRGGSIMITADRDNAVRLWDVATLQEIGPPITVSDSPNGVAGIAVSPDGQILATQGAGMGTTQLWDIAFPAELPSAVCDIAGSPLTHQQWSSDTRSQPYQKVC